MKAVPPAEVSLSPQERILNKKTSCFSTPIPFSNNYDDDRDDYDNNKSKYSVNSSMHSITNPTELSHGNDTTTNDNESHHSKQCNAAIMTSWDTAIDTIGLDIIKSKLCDACEAINLPVTKPFFFEFVI